MKKRTKLSELKLSRLEKIASDLRMIHEDLTVEILHNPIELFPVQLNVMQHKNYMLSDRVTAIVKYCSARGLLFNIYAFENTGLYINIF